MMRESDNSALTWLDKPLVSKRQGLVIRWRREQKSNKRWR